MQVTAHNNANQNDLHSSPNPRRKTRTNDKFPLRRNRQVSLIPKCLPVLLVPSRKLFVHGHRFGLWLRRGGGGGRASSEDVAVWGYSGKLKCG